MITTSPMSPPPRCVVPPDSLQRYDSDFAAREFLPPRRKLVGPRTTVSYVKARCKCGCERRVRTGDPTVKRPLCHACGWFMEPISEIEKAIERVPAPRPSERGMWIVMAAPDTYDE